MRYDALINVVPRNRTPGRSAPSRRRPLSQTRVAYIRVGNSNHHLSAAHVSTVLLTVLKR